LSIDLRAVTVRPTRGGREHRLWDRRVEEHHDLRFHGIVGKGLRHVALHGETWLALIGWHPDAFKRAARDRWIGWSPARQFRRLHLIGNNSRFVILTPGRVPTLASRGLGLSLRRVSAAIEAVHGYPALLAETVVDVARFTGAGCRGGTAFAPFAALLSQEQLKTVESFFNPSKRRCTAPATLDHAISLWTARRAGADTPLAMDGKDIRGASSQTGDGRRMMAAAVEHGAGGVLRQVAVVDKSNGIPAVRDLAGPSTSRAASSPWTRCTPSTRPRAASR